MAARQPAIGLDLGGTKLLGLAVDADGRVLGRALRPTPHGGRDELIAALATTAHEAAAAAGLEVSRTAGVGIGAPGPTDPESGVLLEPPNLPADCHDLALRDLLEPRLGVPVRVENDANVAALGEHRYGAGRGVADLLYITISTGIGGGVIANGRLLRGAGLVAGEIGHMVLAPDGSDICGCGRTGCWEAICSGTGIARQGRAAAGLLRRAGGDAAAVSAELVLQACAAGDPAAQAIVARAVRYNGLALQNLLHLFSPGLIVIGGGLTHRWDAVVAPAARWALAHAMRRAAAACQIVPAQLGDLVGGLGAAALFADGTAL